MTPLAIALADYLQLRRSLGHKLDGTGRHLSRFVTYLDSIGSEVITIEEALAFALGDGPVGAEARHRLTAVRGFARHLAASDTRQQVPPADLVPYRPSRHVPYLFTDDDVVALLAALAATARLRFQASTAQTVIGLLAVTGMRVSEALGLGRDDIDWDEAVIWIRDSKFRKGRNLPVTASTIDTLARYARQRDRRRPTSTRLFVTTRGTPVGYCGLHGLFRRSVTAAGIGAGRIPPPRIHDLRHSFATNTLVGWQRDGLDAEALLPVLSTYLGHTDPRFTYGYLTATPEMLGRAAARLETAQTVIP